jgi:protocatechuate 3,4-dioxygenase beta subunit
MAGTRAATTLGLRRWWLAVAALAGAGLALAVSGWGPDETPSPRWFLSPSLLEAADGGLEDAWVHGQVRGEGGDGVSGARVSVYDARTAAGPKSPCLEGGVTLFEGGCPAAAVLLEKLLQEKRLEASPVSQLPAGPDGHFTLEPAVGERWVLAEVAGKASAVVAVSSQTREVVLPLEALGRLEGRVKDKAQALSGAWVAVASLAPLRLVAMVETDRAGRFVASGLPRAERYGLLVRAPGHPPHAEVVRAEEEASITLGCSVSVKGSVTRRGESVTGARVTWVGGRAVAAADGYGQFLLEGLDCGPALLRAEADGAVGHLALEALERDVQGVEIRLRPGGTLEVVVVDEETKAPLPDARVEVEGELPFLWDVEQGGRFLARTAPAGTYRVVAHAPGHARREAVHTLAAGAKLRGVLALPVGHAVTGGVLREEGARVVGARVSLGEPGAGGAALTGPSGEFALPEVAAGWHPLRVEQDGYLAAELALRVPVAGEVRVKLSREAVLRVSVRTERGEPAGRAVVVLGSVDNPEAILRAQADDEGIARLHRITGGKYWLTAVKAGHSPSPPMRIDLYPGTSDEVALQLSAGLSLSGRVVDGAGLPVAGARVVASREGHPPVTGEADEEGRFEVGGLMPGTYQVLATDGASEGEAEVELSTGGGYVELQLSSPADSLEGLPLGP